MNRVDDMMRDIMGAQAYWFPVFGEIVSFNAAQGVVDVRPSVSRGGEAAPVLKKIPLIMFGGGGWEVDFQPATGDLALVIFCGHNVFQMWNRSKSSEVGNAQFSDAVAIPFSKRISTAGGLVIKNSAGTAKLEVTDTGINVLVGPSLFNIMTHTHSIPTGGTSGPPTIGS